jgi:hypothetical protein
MGGRNAFIGGGERSILVRLRHNFVRAPFIPVSLRYNLASSKKVGAGAQKIRATLEWPSSHERSVGSSRLITYRGAHLSSRNRVQ